MFVELTIAIIAGVSAGVITGLIPGIHINLISIMLLSISPLLLKYTSPLVLALFVISMAITHTFLDFIPSVFLGVPEADTALSILPGHKMVLMGMAYEAVKLTVIGSLLSLIICVSIIPILIFIVPFIYNKTGDYIGFILIGVVAYMILKEKTKNRIFWAVFIFTISGLLGYFVMNFPNLRNPILPLLSGLFGVSMLINSLFENSSVPKQRISEQIEIDKKTLTKSLSAGTFAGSLTGFFPGLGASQASIIGAVVVGSISTFGFLILQGGINTVNFMISLVTLYTLEKARNGAVIAVMKIVENLSVLELAIILAAALIVGGVATFLAMYFTRKFAKLLEKVKYGFLCIIIIILIITLVGIFSGPIGLFILFVSTMIGMIPICSKIGKNHSMGCILLPVILYFVL